MLGMNTQQKEEVFTSPDPAEEKKDAMSKDLAIELDLRSLAEYCKERSKIPDSLWRKAMANRVDPGGTVVAATGDRERLEADDMDNLLHELLQKWWSWKKPGENLVKAMTKQAISDLRDQIVASVKDPSSNVDVSVTTKASYDAFFQKIQQTQFAEVKVDPIRSFETFAGKVFDPTDSGASGKKTIFGGHEVEYMEYASTPAAEYKIETPIQKYRRLKSEITEFEAHLKFLSEQKQNKLSQTTSEVASALSKELTGMWQNLEAQKASCEAAEIFDEARVKTSSELMAKLNTFATDSAGKTNIPKNEQAVFELYSGAGGNEGLRSKELEQRLAKLEELVGNSQGAGMDCMGQLDYIASRLDVIGNPGKLQQINTQSQKLNKQLKQLQKTNNQYKKEVEAIVSNKRQEKADEMFHMMSKWDKVADQVPNVIDRLETLQSLHQETATVVDKVNTLSSQQKAIEQALNEDKLLLTQVQKTLAENAKQIAKNISSLDKRMQGLAKALS